MCRNCDAEITMILHIKVDAKAIDLYYNKYTQFSAIASFAQRPHPTLYSFRHDLGSHGDLKNKRLEEGAITVGKENIF